MKNKILIILGVLCLAATAVFATGINLTFTDNAIKDKDGNVLNADNYHVYKDRLEFFHNAAPNNPTVSPGKMDTRTAADSYRPGALHWYQLAQLNGGTLHVRVWKDMPAGDRRGNYYGKSSHGVASGATPPVSWDVTDLRTAFKADVPYAPAVGTIGESMVRTGDNLQLKLTIPISYDQNGPDGKREATGFSLLVTYPDGRTETKNGSSIVLNNTPSGTYKFKPTATNWYGSTEGPEVTYTTLGLGAAGPLTVTYELVHPADVLAVNSFPFPFTSVSDPGAIASARELIMAVNNAAGANIVTTLGWWNAAGQEPAGYIVTYTSETLNDFGAFTRLGNAQDDPANEAVVRDQSYQVSVIDGVSTTFVGTR